MNLFLQFLERRHIVTHVKDIDKKTTKASVENEGPTVRHWIRGIGSLLILLLVFWIIPNQMPSELEAPRYNEATFNTEQQEAYEQVMESVSRRSEALEISVVDGVTMYSYTGRKPTPERPEWLDENNRPTVPDDLKERIAARATLKAPSWMRHGDATITYASYNNTVSTGPFFGFLGLLTSISLYLVFFWAFPGRRERKKRLGALAFIALMAVFMGYIVPEFTVIKLLRWPLIFFGFPMFVMFLLWAFTRDPTKNSLGEPPEAGIEKSG